MNWIRIATKMKGDPRLGAIATSCRVKVHEAVGLVCCVLMEFPDHARDGDIAAVPDVVLEQWALWTGKPGAFAQAFRAHLCDETGAVRSWEKHNGAAIRESDAARERMKERREMSRRSVKRTPNVRGTFAERSENDSSTVRRTFASDGTGRDITTSPAAAAEVVAPATVDRIGALGFTTDDHRDAALGYVRAAQFPEAVLAHLAALRSGQHGPGGQPVPADTLGQALLEMRVAGARFGAATLAKFLARVGQPVATIGLPAEPTWDDVLATMNRGGIGATQ